MPPTRARDISAMDPRLLQEAVEFIREWLPSEVRSVYRSLIVANPDSWQSHPHFANGFFIDRVLRGNGLTEKTLGVQDLKTVWADLLCLALDEDQTIMVSRKDNGGGTSS